MRGRPKDVRGHRYMQAWSREGQSVREASDGQRGDDTATETETLTNHRRHEGRLSHHHCTLICTPDLSVASTVAAIQYSGAPTWFSAAYVRIYRLLIRLASDAFASPVAARPPSIRLPVVLVLRARACRLASSH